MDVVNYKKLLQAIELVAYNRLDECRDDTLIEKLVTVFDDSFDRVKCKDEELIEIFNVCKQAIVDWKIDPSKVFISPVLSFMFKLVSSSEVHNIISRKPIIEQLNQLIDLKPKIFKSDYSIQFNYVKGLTKLFANRQGSKVLFNEGLVDESFVQSLINVGIESKSYFVRESLQQCLVELLKCQNGETLRYFQLLVSSFELKLNKFQVKIISQLVSNDVRSTIIKQLPDLNQKLIVHVNCQTNEHVTIQLVELLACSLEDESQINFVFIKLIKNKLLKSLITFSTHLAIKNANYLNKWFTYVVLPLEIQLEDKLVSSDQFSHSEFDRQLVKSLTNEKTLIYCLYYLKMNFPKRLDSQQLNLVFEIISRFVKQSIRQGKIKLLRESLLMIGNLGKKLDDLDSKLFGTLFDLLTNLLWSENFQCECLIWLRHLFESDFNCRAKDQTVKSQVINLVEELLKLKLNDDNLDVVDGGLELLDVLVRKDYLKLNELNECTLKSIFDIWNYSSEHSENYLLKVSCISILPNLKMQLDQSTLDRLTRNTLNGFENDVHLSFDILEIIWKCLKDENSLVRRKVIESIKECFLDKNHLNKSMISALLSKHGELYLGICYHVSESVLFDIDADIQLAAMNLLKNLICDLINRSESNNLIESTDRMREDETSRIKYKGLIYFVHCLHFTIMSNLVSFTVKEECLNVLQLIKNSLNEHSVSKTDLIVALGDMESVFEYQVNSHRATNDGQSSVSYEKRDEQLNEMFRDNLFRTEEIIAQFTSERVEQAINSSPTEKSADHQTPITSRMAIENLLEFLYTFDSKSILNNEVKVDFLDDILAARASDDVIIDCY